MSAFARDVLGLVPSSISRPETDFFDLPDGSMLAVKEPCDLDPAERTVGFLVDDVEAAAAELEAAGITTDQVQTNGIQRYVHFRAPDGQLYELIDNLAVAGG
jgi:glyoxylase I family protein